ITVLGGTLLGLAIALVLNERFPGRGLLRALLLLPWTMPPVVAGIIWRLIFDDGHGTLNALLRALGLLQNNILFFSMDGGALALYIVALAFIWCQAPLAALLFLAALQAIPANLARAARADGANAWQRFWRITMPWLRPTLFLVLLLLTLNG